VDTHSSASHGSHYAEDFERYRRLLNRTVRTDLRIFEIPKDARILDLGCAFGDDIRRLEELGYSSVSGVEPDPYCVAGCADLDVTQGTIENTGLPSSSFEVVLVDNVFHHIPDYAAALDEIRRVLGPSGLLCFTEPRRSLTRSLMDFVTFHTPLPRFLGGPFLLRREIIGQELETGLYPRWLDSHPQFFALLDQHFAREWLRRKPLFYTGKYRLRG
jgi:SAM-dependent methyltransferase